MRIIFITHFFPPEEPPAAFLAFEFAKALSQAGHEVDVLTSFPNWPTGFVFPGYDNKKLIIEKNNGLSIYRLPFLASPSGGFIKRAIDFTSFQFLVKWHGKKLQRPDIIYVLVPPNEDGLAARYLAKHFNCPYVLNIQDIHPDTSINLGYIKNKLLIKLLKHQESKMYRDATHVVAIGNQMKKTLIQKGIPAKKINVLSNWIDTDTVKPDQTNNALRKEWQIPDDAFIVLYAGTFGRIHGTSILLDLANEIKKENILLLLVGQGQGFNQIKATIQGGSYPNIILKNFVPRERLSELQALANVSIVLTKQGFGLTSVPSKVLGYMAAARPVLAAIDPQSDTAELISIANAGMVVEPENLTEIKNALIYMYNNNSLLIQWGKNARSYAIDHLSPSAVLNHGVMLLENIAKKSILC